ncbi:hypothetical protein TNCT_41631, partial [Trichonephila clavata]
NQLLGVDITHTEPWVINTYTLVVHRLTITHGEPPFDPSYLTKSVVYIRSVRCGYHPLNCVESKEMRASHVTGFRIRKKWPTCPSVSWEMHQVRPTHS